MKHTLILLSYACCLLTASAAVPLSWTVDMKRAQPATFEAYQGEVIAIEATLHADGKPFEAPLNYSLFWQTNGMGRLYWEAPCSRGTAERSETAEGRDIPVAATNVLFATWLPSYDVGAKVYNCFIGSPSNNYHTAFQLRLRPSPGATPNALPLPTPVIDFAKVRVLNPPWESGGSGVNTNAVIDIIREQLATNGIRSVDGAAKMLPKYLHERNFDDSYPEAAEEYYRSRGDGKTDGGCSAVRSGGYLYRNFDYPFDDRAEFVVKMSAGPNRFASVGVAQVGTNLTESIVTSGKPSPWYKALPGATVDGINENGVVAEINVVDGTPPRRLGGDIHPLAAVRWALDNGTSAAMVASNLAARIQFPSGWTQNFHWMIADERETWIVENGSAHAVTNGVNVMTNFRLYGDPKDTTGAGQERYDLLFGGANITNAWYTRAYLRSTNWVSEFKDAEEMEAAKSAWETYPRESLRGHGLWQTVHTSVYDITNRVLRVAVQETDDWYTFQVPAAGGVKVETDPTVPAWAKQANPPEGMTANALVLTNGAVKTKGGTAVTPANIGAYARSSEVDIGDDGLTVVSYARLYFRPDSEYDSSYSEYGKTHITYYNGYSYFIFDFVEKVMYMSDDYGNAQYWYLPQDRSGIIAVENWQSLAAMADSATNATARASVGAKMMTLIDQPVEQKINNSVSANMNRYIDKKTGVEYVGDWYDGSMYFVPTGNVYPPNN